jgi:hypothetical protein
MAEDAPARTARDEVSCEAIDEPFPGVALEASSGRRAVLQ